MKTLLITGAGASAELGVPTMHAMLAEFREMLRPRQEFRNAVAQLDALLVAKREVDMEDAINEIETLCVTSKTLRMLERIGDESQWERVVELRSEAEWFVQHACERMNSQRATRMWERLLKTASPESLQIVTTNYDRAIEIAAEAAGVELDDGFERFTGREWADWRGFDATNRGIRLLKMHGSTDWYRRRGSEIDVVKLRHAMPLYGGVTLRLDDVGREVGSALVLPTREKLTTLHPYPDLTYRLHASAGAVDVVVLLGTAVRDSELRAVIRERHHGAEKWLYVSRSGKTPAGFESQLRPIKMAASQFLTRIAPHLVTAGSGAEVESLVRQVETADASLGLGTDRDLGLIAAVHDKGRSRSERVLAIEHLVGSRSVLNVSDIESALKDEDAAISACAASLLLGIPDGAIEVERLLSPGGGDWLPVVRGELELVREELRQRETSSNPTAELAT